MVRTDRGNFQNAGRGGPRSGSGRPRVPAEQDPQGFEMAVVVGVRRRGPRPVRRRAARAAGRQGRAVQRLGHRRSVAGGVGGDPLPKPFDPLDPDKGLRRLAAKAKRAAERHPPSEWLIRSAGAIRRAPLFRPPEQYGGHVRNARHAGSSLAGGRSSWGSPSGSRPRSDRTCRPPTSRSCRRLSANGSPSGAPRKKIDDV